MTATPHSGKPEDFQLFMALLDPDRFEGKPRKGVKAARRPGPDAPDGQGGAADLRGQAAVPRAPRLHGHVPALARGGAASTTQVTEYVREEMNRAERLKARGRGPPRERRRLRAHRAAAPPRLLARGDLPVAAASPRAARDAAERGAARAAAAASRAIDLTDGLERARGRRRPARGRARGARGGGRRPGLRGEDDRRARGRDRDASRGSRQLAEQVRAIGHRREVDAARRAAPGQRGRDVRRDRQAPEADRLHRAPRHAQLPDRPDPHAARAARGGRRRSTAACSASCAARRRSRSARTPTSSSSSRPTRPARASTSSARTCSSTTTCRGTRTGSSSASAASTASARPRSATCGTSSPPRRARARCSSGCSRSSPSSRRRSAASVFDVLGDEIFEDTSLRDLLIEAVRYGDQPEVRAQARRDRRRGRRREARGGAQGARAAHRDDERDRRRGDPRADGGGGGPQAPAALHPRRSSSRRSGCSAARSRSASRAGTRSRNVPAEIRNRGKALGAGVPVVPRYTRVTFEKALDVAARASAGAAARPGHPLLDATVDLVLERYRPLLKQGAMLVADADESEGPARARLRRARDPERRELPDGQRQVVSKRLQFVELTEDWEPRLAGYAPYLDYRPIEPDELELVRHADRGGVARPRRREGRARLRDRARRARAPRRGQGADRDARRADEGGGPSAADHEIQLLGPPRQRAEAAGARRQAAADELGPRAAARRRARGPAQAADDRARPGSASSRRCRPSSSAARSSSRAGSSSGCAASAR